MPADRTRGSKRGAADTLELTWTEPIDASKPQSIAFAPNVTPGTFNDPPETVDPSTESMLFPPTPDSPSSNRRHAHSKKKPENHIPRPPNAFILFRSSFIKNQHVSSEVETNHSTLSKIIGLTWQNLPHEERQIWHAKAKQALDEHRRKFPQYAFRPSHGKGKGTADKRKVREVGPKDMKRCARIAELLVEGKKGSDLDVAIAEFDRHHVPEIVTRFEAPITARAYRRSSSAPVPDTDHSKPAFLPSTPKSQKPRATSSEPSAAFADSYSDCQSPSPSQGDFEATGEYLPDSPFSLSTASPTYTLPETNPSFNLNTFSFDLTTTAMPMESYDPLMVSQGRMMDPFSQDSSPPCTPQSDGFDPASLTIDTTSFFDPFACQSQSSSPISSMPSTPAYSAVHDSCTSFGGAEVDAMPPLVDYYTPSFDFMSDVPNYANGIPPMYSVPTSATISFIPEYCNASKPDFSSFYEKQGMDAGFQASYLSPIPTYGL